jgi:RNA polymerase sigma-70 factor (ECF subfamily)
MNTLKMNTLKVLTTDSHVYNVKRNINVEEKIMESRPVNPERAVDQKLVEKAQKGDKKAFGMLVEKYQRRLTRLLSRMVRDQSEIEDIVQDSFIKAYRAINNFRGDSAFYTWLYRIGINTAKNYLVKLGKRPKAMNDVEIEDIENFEDAQDLRNLETPESSMMSSQIIISVNQTIESLPDELKEAISLREMDGLSYEEISDLMNCPVGTVRSRIFRAREAISEKLKPLIETTNKRW